MQSAEHSRLLRPEPTGWPDITHCIFDLDGTLFRSEKFKTATFEQAKKCVGNILSLSAEEAESLLRKRRSELEVKLGYVPALSTTIVDLGATVEQWAHFQAQVSIPETLERDPLLRASFGRLVNRFTLIVYSNMSGPLAESVLSYFGIRDHFRAVVSPADVGSTKPDIEAVQKIAHDGLIVLKKTLSVGDRYHIDLAPVISLGGYGYLVSSRASLDRLFELLSAAIRGTP